MAASITVLAEAGAALTVASINTALGLIVAGTGLNVGNSFGTVFDILRILSGEVYVSPRFVIVCTVGDDFRTLAQRNVFVAAQRTDLTGITFSSIGHFLAATEVGFQAIPVLARTGNFNISMASGDLAVAAAVVGFTNPSFAYAAADVTAWRVLARDIAGTAIPATGLHAGIRVYDTLGNCLL